MTSRDDGLTTSAACLRRSFLCTFFQYALPRTALARYMRSSDGGATWTKPVAPHPNAGGFGNGSAIQLADGTVA